MMKRFGVLCGALALAMGAGLLVACSQAGSATSSFAVATPAIPERLAEDKGEAWIKTLDENPVSESFLSTLSSFAYRSAAPILTESQDAPANSAYSPLSLYYALALADQGAAGQTASEINEALGVPAGTEVANELGNLYRQLAEDPRSKIDLANSIWMEKSNPFEQSFIATATQQFYATPFSVEFGTSQTDEAIAAWIAENTGDMIKPEVETEKDQLLSIINTVHFKGSWLNQFDTASTAKDTFHTTEGDVEAEFMAQRLDSVQEYLRTDTYERASLSFADGAVMTFVLPAEGVSAESILADQALLEEAFTTPSSKYAFVTYTLPKATFASTFDLIPPLERMGVQTAFSDQADFSNLTATPAYISSVKQESAVSWDENGAEASAYTAIGISKMSAMPEEGEEVDFRLDRPFLFQISTSQGIPLFVGVCGNPAEAK